MLEAAFEAAGLNARYVSLEVDPADLAAAVFGARAVGLRGLHVTAPHKVAVVPLVDSLTSAAELSGAVNCIKRVGESSSATTRTGVSSSTRSERSWIPWACAPTGSSW